MKFLSTITLVFSFAISFSQSQKENLAKYWFYRDRLKYFVIAGDRKGESEIAWIRNAQLETGISWGQHGIVWGYYVGMLATEYKLLHDNNLIFDAAQTKKELNLALQQYVNYMDKCEQQWATENILIVNKFDGFFVRDNVSANFLNEFSSDSIQHKTKLNKDLSITDTWNGKQFGSKTPGIPGYVDYVVDGISNKRKPSVMSQDEAIGVLMGVVLVCKCLEIESEEYILAKNIICNIVNYLYANNWRIVKPNGEVIKVDDGGFAWAFACAFKKISDFSDCNFTWDVSIIQKLVWKNTQYYSTTNIEWNNAMAATLAALSNSWYSFGKNTTEKGIERLSSPFQWHYFYKTLWAFLWDKKLDSAFFKATENILNSSPKNGPYNYTESNFASGGWAYQYRWRATLHEQNFGSNTSAYRGNYNGLDYMLMHNLYLLVNPVVNFKKQE